MSKESEDQSIEDILSSLEIGLVIYGVSVTESSVFGGKSEVVSTGALQVADLQSGEQFVLQVPVECAREVNEYFFTHRNSEESLVEEPVSSAAADTARAALVAAVSAGGATNGKGRQSQPPVNLARPTSEIEQF